MGRFKRLGTRALSSASARILSAIARADEAGGEVRDRIKDRLARRTSTPERDQRRPDAPSPSTPYAKVPGFDAQAAAAASGQRPGWGNPDRPAQVFGRRSCSWSGRAVRVLQSNHIDYQYIELEGDPNAPRHSELKMETGQNTVPYVFLRGHFIGGYNELSEIERLGQLEYLTLPESERERHPLAGTIEIAPRRD